MSEYKEYRAEREKIDFLINQGYQIEEAAENLSGAFIQFKSKATNERQQLHIKTANARKYFTTLLLHAKAGN